VFASREAVIEKFVSDSKLGEALEEMEGCIVNFPDSHRLLTKAHT
jgi:hypothetical protein